MLNTHSRAACKGEFRAISAPLLVRAHPLFVCLNHLLTILAWWRTSWWRQSSWGAIYSAYSRCAQNQRQVGWFALPPHQLYLQAFTLRDCVEVLCNFTALYFLWGASDCQGQIKESMRHAEDDESRKMEVRSSRAHALCATFMRVWVAITCLHAWVHAFLHIVVEWSAPRRGWSIATATGWVG